MISRLHTAASAMSLLLCMATAGLWISSYRFGLFVAAQPPPHNLTSLVLASEWGAFEAGLYDAMEDNRPKGAGWSISAGAPRAKADASVFHPNGYSRLWFHCDLPFSRDVVVPHWFVLLATGVLPAARLLRRRIPAGRFVVEFRDGPAAIHGGVCGVAPSERRRPRSRGGARCGRRRAVDRRVAGRPGEP